MGRALLALLGPKGSITPFANISARISLQKVVSCKGMNMPDKRGFEPAPPNIFPSHIGLKVQKPSLLDLPLLVALLPVLALVEGADLIRHAWAATGRSLWLTKRR
jgi:hypothetical protein